MVHLLTIVKTMMNAHVSWIDEHAGYYARMLGLGRDNDVGVEHDSDVDNESGQLNDALKVVAEQRGSVTLIRVWVEEKGSGMSPETAYQTLDFGETVYMDRFLDSADLGKKARSKAIHTELTAARERVQHLTQEKACATLEVSRATTYSPFVQHAPFAPAFGNTVEYLTKQTVIDLGLDDEFAVSLSHEESLITEQLRVERERTTALKTQMEEIWKDETAAAYELTSVFIHCGSSPSWGYYFFYSRNLPARPDEWFKYNDAA
ncbi:hypothetical protein LXA43DRAFT_1129627 [Ganoderma leucocontextum]|nr:hypothetical protein LXA43DRAFT_1129627 [Ganoderma leucocontextum]